MESNRPLHWFSARPPEHELHLEIVVPRQRPWDHCRKGLQQIAVSFTSLRDFSVSIQPPNPLWTFGAGGGDIPADAVPLPTTVCGLINTKGVPGSLV